jgi:hypothetical protein
MAGALRARVVSIKNALFPAFFDVFYSMAFSIEAIMMSIEGRRMAYTTTSNTISLVFILISFS